MIVHTTLDIWANHLSDGGPGNEHALAGNVRLAGDPVDRAGAPIPSLTLPNPELPTVAPAALDQITPRIGPRLGPNAADNDSVEATALTLDVGVSTVPRGLMKHAAEQHDSAVASEAG